MATGIQRTHYDLHQYEVKARVVLFNVPQVGTRKQRNYSARDCTEVYKVLRNGLGLTSKDMALHAGLTGDEMKRLLEYGK